MPMEKCRKNIMLLTDFDKGSCNILKIRFNNKYPATGDLLILFVLKFVK